MLKLESRKTYIVYPSWAELPAKWADLPRLLEYPLFSGFLDSKFDYRRFGYPEAIQPFELIDGPAGGGIIAAAIEPGEKWLPGVVLSRDGVSIAVPSGMAMVMGRFTTNVFYLDPPDGPLVNLPFAPSSLRWRARRFVCGTTVEHVGTAGDRLYWMILARSSRKEPEGLERVPEWARAFGLEAVPLAAVDPAVLAEVEPWIAGSSYRGYWLEVTGGGDTVGYHHAIVVYLAYLLRESSPRRMYGMHLIGDIEGRPNSLAAWRLA